MSYTEGKIVNAGIKDGYACSFNDTNSSHSFIYFLRRCSASSFPYYLYWPLRSEIEIDWGSHGESIWYRQIYDISLVFPISSLFFPSIYVTVRIRRAINQKRHRMVPTQCQVINWAFLNRRGFSFSRSLTWLVMIASRLKLIRVGGLVPMEKYSAPNCHCFHVGPR